MSCATCKFAQFERTPTGRFMRKVAGRCMLPIPPIALPACMTASVSRTAIWPDMGADCPTYKPQEQEPK